MDQVRGKLSKTHMKKLTYVDKNEDREGRERNRARKCVRSEIVS